MALVGATVTLETEGGATGRTVIVAEPLLVSLVAVIDAEPGATAVTTPAFVTVAIVGALVDHVTTRPDSVAPFASRTVAERVTVPPMLRLAVPGATATDATGTGGGGATEVTTTCAVPIFPSIVALIVVVPAPIAETRPAALTVATAALAVLQVTGRPLRVFPFASVATAASEADCPTFNAAEDGATDTAATGITVTVIADDAVFPSDVPDMVADPALTAVTFPVPSTVATDGALLAHVTALPVSALPLAS